MRRQAASHPKADGALKDTAQDGAPLQSSGLPNPAHHEKDIDMTRKYLDGRTGAKAAAWAK